MNIGMFEDLHACAQAQIVLLQRIVAVQESILAEIQQSVALTVALPVGDEPGPVVKSPEATAPKRKGSK